MELFVPRPSGAQSCAAARMPAEKHATSIVYIEDDEKLARLTARFLESHNVRISLAVHGREGIARVLRERPDVVLLDQMRPAIDGFEVCRELRACADAPILMVMAPGGVLAIRRDELDATVPVIDPDGAVLATNAAAGVLRCSPASAGRWLDPVIAPCRAALRIQTTTTTAIRTPKSISTSSPRRPSLCRSALGQDIS